ncbi:hypothetical protein F511_07488 [Dorcoceras hygrometricum]|uniref:Uncharacterized protein n=1 Tax=Dorcoceras hygrometricum TaxID=472368 RepID=A0A2Z7D649_9LAMI|nr:hypothetical protein F511_07488 [Dorcoceras hygrometricum]
MHKSDRVNAGSSTALNQHVEKQHDLVSLKSRAAITHVLEMFVRREVDQFGAESPTFPLLPQRGRIHYKTLITTASVATRSDSPQAAITPIYLCTPARKLCV